MANITHKLQSSVTSSTGSTSVSGYDGEAGNSEIVINESFAASSTNASLTLALTAANLQAVYLVCDKGCTITTNGTSTADVQTISITGTPTGGTFPIGFNGQVCDSAYNTSAATLQTTLRAMSSIGGSNITCSGGPLPGTPIVCTFAGTLATKKQPLMVVSSASLTGGSTPTVSVAHTTPGQPSDTIVLQAGIPLVWGASMTGVASPFSSNVTTAFVTCTPACRLQGKILTS